MRNLYIVLFSSILLYACAGSKDVQLGSVNQEPCRQQSDVTEKNVFTGESVENLNVFQQGSAVYASMDVRTECNSNVAFDMERNDDQIKLKIRNASSNAECVCIKKVTTSIANLEEGDYKVTVTNAANQLLAQGQISVKE
jgi:hypothetical protein